MDLKILSLENALNFNPVKPTYAIRIFKAEDKDVAASKLIDSPLYMHITNYRFENNNNNEQSFRTENESTRIDKVVTRAIVEDFSEYYKNIECLLIHCSTGKNRSPAVAIALNDIFALGHDSIKLMKKYKQCDKYAYLQVLLAGIQHIIDEKRKEKYLLLSGIMC